jgi:hypothetical protein
MDFEKNIMNLKKNIPIKNDLNEKDLIIFALPDMILYGFVHKIERDMVVKIGTWWHVTFTILSLPLLTTTLIMRTEQMTGQETFTVDGENRFFAALDTDKLYQEKIPLNKKIKSNKKTTLKVIK